MPIKRSYLILAASIAILITAVACGQTISDDPATPAVLATATAVETLEPTQAPSSGVPATSASPTVPPLPTVTPQVPTSTAVPASPAVPSTPAPTLPPASANGNGVPTADDAVLKPGAQEFTTVDVVKLLRPYVVQITTRTLAMGLFNQPVPNTGVGTGVILDTIHDRFGSHSI